MQQQHTQLQLSDSFASVSGQEHCTSNCPTQSCNSNVCEWRSFTLGNMQFYALEAQRKPDRRSARRTCGRWTPWDLGSTGTNADRMIQSARQQLLTTESIEVSLMQQQSVIKMKPSSEHRSSSPHHHHHHHHEAVWNDPPINPRGFMTRNYILRTWSNDRTDKEDAGKLEHRGKRSQCVVIGGGKCNRLYQLCPQRTH